MKRKGLLVRPAVGAILAAGGAALIVACGGGSSDSSGTTTAATATVSSYAGPGSRWDVSLAGDGTFSITKREAPTTPVVVTITGDYTELSSGFLKLTVGTVSADPGVDAPSVGDVGYALSVPGYVFILKPLDATDDQIIPMVSSGTCPSADIDANWVVVNVEDGVDASDAGTDFLGTFHFDVGTGTPSLPARYSLSQNPVGMQNMNGGNCSDGVLVVDGEAEMYLTTNGGAIVRTGIATRNDETDDTYIFGFAKETLGSVGAVAGDYAGLLFDGSQSAGSQISPISITCDALGACTGTMVTDIEANTLSSETVTINLTTADNPDVGFITGTISDSSPGSSAGNLSCMANIDAQGSGKNIVTCAGQSPGDPTKLFNVLLVSK